MGVMWLYSLGVCACVTVLYLVARTALGGLSFLRLRRFVLLAVCVVSLLLPVVPLVGGSPHLSSRPVSNESATVEVGELTVERAEESVSPLLSGVLFAGGWIYLLGALGVGAYFVCGSVRLRRYMNAGDEVEGTDGRVIVVESDKYAPFSWGGRIAIPATDYGGDCMAMLVHEEAHMHLRHWIDLVLMAVLCALTWYWPVTWMMRRELREIHEYEADRAVIESGVEMADYQMLLIKKTAGSRFQSLASSLNHSSLKKRITMMMSKPTKGTARLRALAMVPAVAIVAAVMCSPSLSAQVGSILAVGGISDKVTNSAAFGDNSGVKISSFDEKERVYETVEHDPTFPGGTSALYDFLQRNLIYPPKAAKDGVQGTVSVRFVVKSDGSIGEVQMLRGKHPELDAEAVRIVKKLPRFNPGMMNGKPVSVWYTLPIRFRLSSPAAEQPGEKKAE